MLRAKLAVIAKQHNIPIEGKLKALKVA